MEPFVAKKDKILRAMILAWLVWVKYLGSMWVWSGNTTTIEYRPNHNHSLLFLSEMIWKLERTICTTYKTRTKHKTPTKIERNNKHWIKNNRNTVKPSKLLSNNKTADQAQMEFELTFCNTRIQDADSASFVDGYDLFYRWISPHLL